MSMPFVPQSGYVWNMPAQLLRLALDLKLLMLQNGADFTEMN